MRILLLGDTGKLGSAIKEKLTPYKDVEVVGISRSNGHNICEIENYVKEHSPDFVINCIAEMGIDNCEYNPGDAMAVNAFFPKLLAELSNKYNYTLIHFSTECVFGVRKALGHGRYTEIDTPAPINVYGSSKYLGDCYIEAIAKKYYILRLPLLFGEGGKGNQFVEKMIDKLIHSETIRVAIDVITTPTYTNDVADTVISAVLCGTLPRYGLYHMSNGCPTTLYEFISTIKEHLDLPGTVELCSDKEFIHKAYRNTVTPLASIRLNYVRPSFVAAKEYCERLKQKWQINT